MPDRLTAWSYSRLQTYEQCPLRAKLLYLDKLPEPKGPPLTKGIAAHEACEKWLNDGAPLPPELARHAVAARALQKTKARGEVQWALTREWQPTGWFGPATWCRVVVDVLVDAPLKVIDYKTGKKKDSHRDQMRLYALAALCQYPSAPKVDVELWYLDHGTVAKDSYTRENVDLLQRSWTARVEPMLQDTIFAPTPGPACRWCHFRKSNGGVCEYG